jgi:hypothetical protein
LLGCKPSSAAGPQRWRLAVLLLCCGSLPQLLSPLQERIMWIEPFIVEPMVAWVFGPADFIPIRACKPEGVCRPHGKCQRASKHNTHSPLQHNAVNGWQKFCFWKRYNRLL